jgi:hypothetical protein
VNGGHEVPGMTMTNHAPGAHAARPYEEQIGALPIYDSYRRSPYLSSKHSSYFQVYSDLLEKYRGREFVFVEIGVLNGGSLFMWRDFFGPQARIIGVEFNPGATRWEKEGFEIHIGSQADPEFWARFFHAVGPVDVVLDDGGHTYEQQILTAHHCIPQIRDGGLLIVEDTHTSYFEEYGYPTKYSFVEWTKRLIDDVNSRFPRVNVSDLPYQKSIYSISVFESVVCFAIDRRKCFESRPTVNDGISLDAQDFRHRDSVIGTIDATNRQLSAKFRFLKHIPLLRTIKDWVFLSYRKHVIRKQLKKLGSFFEPKSPRP